MRRTTKSFFWAVRRVALASMLLAAPLTSAISAPSVTGINLVSSVRTGRTTFDYTYTINVQNDATARIAVTATVTSTVAATVVVQGVVQLPNLAANEAVTSTNTFTIQQDRTFSFNAANLQWSVASTPVAGGGLPGNPAALATSALTDQILSPNVPHSVVDSDPALGQIARNRLLLQIQATTTIGQVNAALASINASIVSSLTGYSGIEIEFADPGSVAALKAIAAKLAAMPGIAGVEEVGVGGFLTPNELPKFEPAPIDDKLADLAAAKAPAVWNTRGLLSARGAVPAASGKVSFVQADFFGLGGPGANLAVSTTPGWLPGNSPTASVPQHGYSVLSRTLFDFNGSNASLRPEGASIGPFTTAPTAPFTSTTLIPWLAIDLQQQNVPTMDSMLAKIVAAIRATPGNVVFNASLGSCNAGTSGVCNLPASVTQVRSYALKWLKAVRSDVAGPGAVLSAGPLESRFVVTTSAGNDTAGLAKNNNAWSAAALQQYVDAASGLPIAPAPNVLVVESNTVAAYGPSQPPTPACRSLWPAAPNGSTSGGNVAAFGQGIAGHGLLVASDGANGAVQDANEVGTSFAAPQVAGLAIYLWKLAPTLQSTEIVSRVLGSASIPRACAAAGNSAPVIDAYATVLSLDSKVSADLSVMQIRGAVLDVTDAAGTGAPDGTFTLSDFKAIADNLALGPTQPQPDFSRYDLNGDGFTGGTSTAPFDLDTVRANGKPKLVAIAQTQATSTGTRVAEFDENNVTDLDVLCYYGYGLLLAADATQIDATLTGINTARHSNLSCGPQVLVHTGVDSATGLSGTFTGFESKVSVSNDGSIAFSGTDSVGATSGFVVSAPGTITNVAPGFGSTTRNFGGSAINSATPVARTAFRERVAGAPPSTLMREWAANGNGGPTQVGKSGTTTGICGFSPDGTSTNAGGACSFNTDCPVVDDTGTFIGFAQCIMSHSGDFDSASFFQDINDVGIVAFPALINGSTQTALFAGSSEATLKKLVTFPAPVGSVVLRPQIANTGDIVYLDDQQNIKLVNYTTGVTETVSPATTCSGQSQRPGISGDATFVVFSGTCSGTAGVWLVGRFGAAGNVTYPVLVSTNGDSHGLPGQFSSFNVTTRYGVASTQQADGSYSVTIVFSGTRAYTANGNAVANATGVYRQKVAIGKDITGAYTVVTAAPPRKVVEIGDQYNHQAITALDLWDPISRSGDWIALWAQFADGSQAILRAN